MSSLIIIIATIFLLVLSVLLFPSIKIGNVRLGTYWLISLLGAIILLFVNQIDLKELLSSFVSSSIGPIPILILFISMTILSIFLDEIGFFKYLASVVTQKAKGSQLKIFVYLYLLTSVLTVFTSNDIIILTFTPFICYFTRRTKINPIPYLVAEFIGANTWSMMLIIGNPTNIFIATKQGILFLDYFIKMVIPTICGGVLSFGILLLLFRKSLSKPLEVELSVENKPNKVLLILGLIHLIGCTTMLVISGYINIPMVYIAAGFALSLIICLLIYYIVIKTRPYYVVSTLKRAPWTLVPFLLSMFTIVYIASIDGFILKIAEFIDNINSPFATGYIALLSCNLVNNIPMSVMFSEILSTSLFTLKECYIVIAASNIGAFLTPIGALAGVMWMNILKKQGINYRFIDFIKYGFLVAVPTLGITILMIILL